jgi:hypothetical protein
VTLLRESARTLCWSFRENRRPIELRIKRSVWVGFSIFFPSTIGLKAETNTPSITRATAAGGKRRRERRRPPPARLHSAPRLHRSEAPPPSVSNSPLATGYLLVLLSTGTGWPHVEETLQDSSVSPSSQEFFEIVKVEQPDKIQILTSLRLILC